MDGLLSILRADFKLPVCFEFRERQRTVIVVSGDYRFCPLSGNAGLSDEAFVPYDQIDIFESDRSDLKEIGGSSLGDLFEYLAQRLGHKVIDRIGERPKNLVYWRHKAARFREQKRGGGVQVETLLSHLSRQTGLKFEQTQQPVELLEVSLEFRPDVDANVVRP